MTSKERVLAAVRRQKPDRTPCNFRAEQPTLRRLYDHIGHHDYERLLRELHVDIRYVDAIAPPERDRGAYIENFWGERYIYRDGPWGKVRDDMPGALSQATTLCDFERFPWPSVDQMDYSNVPSQCDRAAGYAIVYGFCDIFTRPSIVRGFETFLLDMYENPAFVDHLIRRFVDFYIDEYTRAQRESGGRIDIFLIMGDLATQLAPLFDPRMFDEFIAPHLTRLCARIHELGAYAMYHSCGAAYRFMDRLIGCGVDIIDPMQRTNEDMAPENLQRSFGDRACFHGGIDVQTTLPHGSEADIRAEVRRYMDAFADGGYIISSAHYMQHDTPPQSILCMYDEIFTYGNRHP